MSITRPSQIRQDPTIVISFGARQTPLASPLPLEPAEQPAFNERERGSSGQGSVGEQDRTIRWLGEVEE